MADIWQRIVENFLGRFDGPLHFRMIIQPLMATIFALLDGIKDAKNNKPAYLWTVVFNPESRRDFLKDGWKHMGKIFILAVILDVVYQLKVFHKIYPGEILIVAFILAIVPYVLLRGPVNRLMRLFAQKKV
jgi:hypothetical protein